MSNFPNLVQKREPAKNLPAPAALLQGSHNNAPVSTFAQQKHQQHTEQCPPRMCTESMYRLASPLYSVCFCQPCRLKLQTDGIIKALHCFDWRPPTPTPPQLHSVASAKCILPLFPSSSSSSVESLWEAATTSGAIIRIKLHENENKPPSNFPAPVLTLHPNIAATHLGLAYSLVFETAWKKGKFLHCTQSCVNREEIAPKLGVKRYNVRTAKEMHEETVESILLSVVVTG